jgi:hypothetical protein
VYLQHALKDGSAKQAIEGLSRSGEYYSEAIDCLKARYDRPRLIHQTHVRMILDAPTPKDGTGKELRKLHDTVQQHLRALKAMDYEPSGPFITSVLELKLDVDTMFEWQKHSQSSATVPHYQELLEFINLRAQTSETSVPKNRKSTKNEIKRPHHMSSKPVASFATSTSASSDKYILCKTDKHPLYACPKFKVQTPDKMISTLKTDGLCMNCLKPGHFVKQCKLLHQVSRMSEATHTTRRCTSNPRNFPPIAQPSMQPTVNPVLSNTAMGFASNSLLMTCHILVDTPDDSSVETCAIIDSASSASFVSEHPNQTRVLKSRGR